MYQEMSLWERMQRSELNPFVEAKLTDEQRLTPRDVRLSELRTQNERDGIAAMLAASARSVGKVCAV